MQRNERVVHGFALREQPLAAADDARVSSLREIDLIFDQLHHGLAGGEKVDAGELVLAEHIRHALRFAEQGMVVGAGAV